MSAYCSKCGSTENANCMYVNGQDKVLCSACMVAEERDWYERSTKPADREAVSDEELLENCGYPTVAELREKGVLI